MFRARKLHPGDEEIDGVHIIDEQPSGPGLLIVDMSVVSNVDSTDAALDEKARQLEADGMIVFGAALTDTILQVARRVLA